MISIFLTLLEQICIYLPLLLGAHVAFSLLQIPFLAIERAYVFGALMSSLINTPPYSSLSTLMFLCCIAMLGGIIAGFITYALKYYVRVSYLLASIITMGLFHGINQLVINGSHVSLATLGNALSMIPSASSYPQLATLAVLACIIVGLFFYFTRSALGISCGIYGNNPYFFEHYGISGNFIQLMGIIISSSLAGLSGLLVSSMHGFADISMGFGINLFCITVLILGNALAKKRQSIVIPIMGMGIYLIIQQILLHIQFNSRYFTMVQALLVLIILYFTQKYTKGKNYELGL